MALLDENGRLFGRFNVVDAVVAVAIVVLVPFGYASYLLFRTPLPTLERIEPDTLTYAPNMRITIHGANLRPYMRISADSFQGRDFLFSDTTEAQVDLSGVPPGVYDVVLYDYAQERGRLPKALTIQPSALPDARLIAVGMFGNLAPEQASRIAAGMTVDGVGDVVAVGRPVPQVTRVFARPGTVEIPVKGAVMVPATMRMACYVRSSRGEPECVGGGVSLQPATLLFLETPLGTLPFQIDQVMGDRSLEPVNVTVRLSGNPNVLTHVQPGDIDLGETSNELSAGGTVVRAGPLVGSSRDVQLTLQAQKGSVGWTYRAVPLRLGAGFLLRTSAYELSGAVIHLSPLPDAGTAVSK